MNDAALENIENRWLAASGGPWTKVDKTDCANGRAGKERPSDTGARFLELDLDMVVNEKLASNIKSFTEKVNSAPEVMKAMGGEIKLLASSDSLSVKGIHDFLINEFVAGVLFKEKEAGYLIGHLFYHFIGFINGFSMGYNLWRFFPLILPIKPSSFESLDRKYARKYEGELEPEDAHKPSFAVLPWAKKEDVEFTTHAPKDIGDLLTEVKRLRKLLDTKEEACLRWQREYEEASGRAAKAQDSLKSLTKALEIIKGLL